ncbi:MAG: cupredoxin domain-containing protein [Alphaproteobacteria bacterium]
MLKRGIIAAAAFLVAMPAMAADYIANSAEIVKKANWDKMQTVEVTLKEHSYEPEEIKLKANQPYKIVLRNKGEKPHYWTAAEFFKNIATRKGQTKEAEFKVPYFNAVEVNPGGVVDLFIVPVTPGTYQVFCTIDDHREKGMDGKIIIEE